MSFKTQFQIEIVLPGTGSRKVLGIMPTEVMKNKHLKEILIFASIKLNYWQQLKTKTPTLEQHNRNQNYLCFVKVLCYSRNTFN